MSKQSVFLPVVAGFGIGLAALGAFARSDVMSYFAPSAPAEDAVARVAIDRTECDLGQVRWGGSAQARFEVRNVGERRLILRKTNGNCDCTSAGETPAIVEPGGRQIIVATLDTRRGAGPVRTVVYYQTNDPRQPRVCFVCIADVVVP